MYKPPDVGNAETISAMEAPVREDDQPVHRESGEQHEARAPDHKVRSARLFSLITRVRDGLSASLGEARS